MTEDWEREVRDFKRMRMTPRAGKRSRPSVDDAATWLGGLELSTKRSRSEFERLRAALESEDTDTFIDAVRELFSYRVVPGEAPRPIPFAVDELRRLVDLAALASPTAGRSLRGARFRTEDQGDVQVGAVTLRDLRVRGM